jgi:hypothetical protein
VVALAVAATLIASGAAGLSTAANTAVRITSAASVMAGLLFLRMATRRQSRDPTVTPGPSSPWRVSLPPFLAHLAECGVPVEVPERVGGDVLDQVAQLQSGQVNAGLFATGPDAGRAASAVHHTVRHLKTRYPNLPSPRAAHVHTGA